MSFRKFITGLLVAAVIFVVCVKSLPVLYFNMSKSAFDKQDFVKAYKYITNAKNLAPQNSDYRYQYALTLSKLKPTLKIQKEVFELSESKKDDRARFHAKQQIYSWNTQIGINYGINYIEQAPYDSNILRWNPATFPLKIAIEFPQTDNFPQYYKDEISKAFEQWETSTGFIKFTTVDNPRNADIVVKFLPLPQSSCDSRGCKYVVAYTIPTIQNRRLKKMTITLYDKDAYGNYFSDKELYNTILHEIGHALGIMGHSYSSEDLMYMSSEQNQNSIFTRFRSNFQYISSKDLNTIRLLYNMTPTITNTPLNKLNTEGLIYSPIVLGGIDKINKRKIQEAKNYIKTAPNLPNGYIDLGTAYSEIGNINAAIKNFKKALELCQTENEEYIIYFNIAVTYLNNNKPEQALQYAQTARNINNSGEIQELISNIKHAMETKQRPFKDKMK